MFPTPHEFSLNSDNSFPIPSGILPVTDLRVGYIDITRPPMIHQCGFDHMPDRRNGLNCHPGFAPESFDYLARLARINFTFGSLDYNLHNFLNLVKLPPITFGAYQTNESYHENHYDKLADNIVDALVMPQTMQQDLIDVFEYSQPIE